MNEVVMRWERATPVALMGCVIDKKRATGVARFQRRLASRASVLAKVGAYEWRAPSTMMSSRAQGWIFAHAAPGATLTAGAAPASCVTQGPDRKTPARPQTTASTRRLRSANSLILNDPNAPNAPNAKMQGDSF
jgi:hypothetical protein